MHSSSIVMVLCMWEGEFINKLCGRPPQYAPCKLTFYLLTLKVVSESRVTWASSANFSLQFLCLSVLDLGPMYATDVRVYHRLGMPPPRGGA